MVANFTIGSTYIITTSSSPSNGGTTSGGGTYNYGQQCCVDATPNTGWDFVNWTESGTEVSTNSHYCFTVTGNRNLVANFTPEPLYTITTSSSPSNGGTTSGGGTYNYGEQCCVLAIPNTGWCFVNWTENGTPVSTNYHYCFTVTGNRDLVANFTSCNLTLSLPTDATGAPGDTVLIPMTLNNPDNVGIEGIDVTITFDENVLDATGCTLDGTVLENQNYSLQYNIVTPGQIIIVIYANAGLYTGSGIVAYLEFYVCGDVGETTELIFTQADVNESAVTAVDGFFEVIEDEFDICGYIGYFSNYDAVPNADIELTDDGTYSTTTDGNGDYCFYDIPGGNYESTPSKDDDLGGISSVDASRAARFAAGIITLTYYQQIAADVSMNGDISSVDASRIARYAAGLIDCMNPDCIHWVFVSELTNPEDWPPIEYVSTKEYIPLDTDMFDQDFTGIRLGDVTGNWSPDYSSKEEIPSDVHTIIAEKGNSLSIPLVISDKIEIEGIDVALSYNQKVLIPKGVQLTGGILDNRDYEIQTRFENGQGAVIIYAQENLVSGSGVAAILDFEVIGYSNSLSDLYINRFDVNDSEVEGGFQISNLDGMDILTRGLKISNTQEEIDNFLNCSAFPNPFNSSVTIQYNLPVDTEVQVLIYNVRGQLVNKLVNSYETSGQKQVVWNAKKLENGIYFCKIITEKYNENLKLLLMK